MLLHCYTFRQAIHNIYGGYFTVHTEYLLISGSQTVIDLSSVLSLYVFCRHSKFLFCAAENVRLFPSAAQMGQSQRLTFVKICIKISLSYTNLQLLLI